MSQGNCYYCNNYISKRYKLIPANFSASTVEQKNFIKKSIIEGNQVCTNCKQEMLILEQKCLDYSKKMQQFSDKIQQYQQAINQNQTLIESYKQQIDKYQKILNEYMFNYNNLKNVISGCKQNIINKKNIDNYAILFNHDKNLLNKL